jgi:hypothetical protein
LEHFLESRSPQQTQNWQKKEYLPIELDERKISHLADEDQMDEESKWIEL